MTITPREAEILALVRQGKTNKLIARELGIELVTAKTHVSNLLRKLGAGTRVELVAQTMAPAYRPIGQAVTPLPDGHKVVSMVVHKDTVFVATDKGIFYMDAGTLMPVPFLKEAVPMT